MLVIIGNVNKLIIYTERKGVGLVSETGLRLDEVWWVLLIPTPLGPSPRGYLRQSPAEAI